ncbi:MAG: hypothetical protein V1808_00165 [Candidatus Daviesbacteria bacterium]
MSKRTKLFLLVLFCLTAVYLVVTFTNKTPVYKKGSSIIYDMAVSSAITLYKNRVAEGIDMSSGPCLTNDLMPDWVVDIVHSPREKIDDLPNNQCPAFIEERAHHFVELDNNGNLVRVR